MWREERKRVLIRLMLSDPSHVYCSDRFLVRRFSLAVFHLYVGWSERKEERKKKEE